MSTSAPAAPHARDIDWTKSIPFLLTHLVAVVGVVVSGFSWKGLGLALVLYYVRMFGVTAGYHRYFAHRTYKTSRAFQLVLALLAATTAQKGIAWWASHHRIHHKLSDREGDVHSAKRDGFWWSHVGWILSREWDETDESKVRDLLKYPEIRWLERFYLVPVVALAVALFAIGGWFALLWGFFVSTTLLWHGTFTINSLTHMYGSRRFVTGDESRNNFLLALVTLGEGWHNNHHYYQRATNNGFYWWEIDPTFWALRVLSWAGIVWDLHTPPPEVLAANRVADLPAAPELSPAVPAPR